MPTLAGPRRSQRVINQPERTLSGVRTTTTSYGVNKSASNMTNHPHASSSTSSGNPVPVLPQALTSTYGSRIRTGSTLLMQPISTLTHSSAAPTTSLLSMGPAPRRRGGVVNYAEGASDDEFGVDSEEDEEFSGKNSSKRSTPRLGTASFRVGSPSSGMPHRETKQELDKSYLGLIPPSRFFSSKPFSRTRHDYP